MKKAISMLLVLTLILLTGFTKIKDFLFDTKTETIIESVEPLSLEKTDTPGIYVANIAYDSDGDGVNDSTREVEVSENNISTNADGKNIIPIITTHTTVTPKAAVETGKGLLGAIPGFGGAAESIVGLALAGATIYYNRKANSEKKKSSELEKAGKVFVAGINAGTTDGKIKGEILARAKKAKISDVINGLIDVVEEHV